MQTPTPDLIFVLIIGTTVMVVLLVFIFVMVVLSQRRMINYQVALHASKQEVFKAVFEAQEGERQRLAADLHDSVGQVLSVIKLNLHRLKKMEAPAPLPARQALLADTNSLTEDCINEIRNIIHNILPPLLTDYGLVAALQHLATKMEKATGLRIIFRAEQGGGRYAREVEVALYRVTQELLNNALKHARATVIEFSLQQHATGLVFTFTDNGVGFERDKVTPGQGLKNLESRVALLHGEIKLGPGPGGGTLTQVQLQAQPAVEVT
ncbi:sensor histidine kinase [Hymenobacter sp. BT664]|uniref:histidine kinase n=1 Tax=Hymenobacter montanus TaxID=2771359 RepID=A0A927BDN6_9BACT|nr:sensor histidine kinase [Hymenobacter montanus]MBD2768073.1 sensor histidine kinase [Hymenobacter montanus]